MIPPLEKCLVEGLSYRRARLESSGLEDTGYIKKRDVHVFTGLRMRVEARCVDERRQLYHVVDITYFRPVLRLLEGGKGTD